MAAWQMHCVRKTSPQTPKIIESYCSGCGLLVAASPSPRILAMIEELHQCPVCFRVSEGTAHRKGAVSKANRLKPGK